MQRTVADAAANADAAMGRFRLDEAIAAIWTIVDALNGYPPNVTDDGSLYLSAYQPVWLVRP